MKKYLVPVLAVAIAIVGFSFTTEVRKSNLTDYYIFTFSASPSEANVETESLWTFESMTQNPASVVCPQEADQQACRILVTEDYIEVVGEELKLKSSLNIQAAEDENVAYVISIDDPSGNFSNKEREL